ncbi:YtxH domain-containing protein [Parabacteroides goldsteinii]
MGLGLGSIIGAVVYHFSCSSRGKQLKEKVRHVFHKASDNAEELVDEAKDKALQTGTKVADKVADGTFNLAEKADEVKNKVHAFADNAKK